MAVGKLNTVMQQLHRIVGRADGEATDRDLLEQYAQAGDQEAFAGLVRRHGPMVLGVCRRMLGNCHDADDAFQAVFLVLARKSSSIAWQESIGGWLCTVAYRVSQKARASAARRGVQESEVENVLAPSLDTDRLWSDLRPVLDDELNRLPEKYRQPIVLCYLEGCTNEEAAHHLGWPAGTVKVRLMRAREILRDRLGRRGVALSAGAFGSILSANSLSAAVPPALLESTVGIVCGQSVGAALASPVSTLAEGVIHEMFHAKLRFAAFCGVFCVVAGSALGWAVFTASAAGPEPKNPDLAVADKPALPVDPKVKKPAPKPVTVDSIPDDEKATPGAANAAERAEACKGNTAFALDLYSKLRSEKGNLFFSPYSISTALGMTYAGARGDTAKEMEKVMHFTLGQEKIHPAMGHVLLDINGAQKPRKFQLNTVNRLWGQKGYRFDPKFLALTRQNYGAGLHELDFHQDADGSRKLINAWVEKQTKDKIKDLLKPNDIQEVTRLVLTNAIYFKAAWLEPFKESETKDSDFSLTAKEKVKAKFMNQTHDYQFVDVGDAKVLDLPYEGKELSMIVILPKKVGELEKIEKELTPARIEEWTKQMKIHEVTVKLPKFKVTCDFKLKDVLESMGMKRAFDKMTADFSGMTTKEQLYISAVIHKAFVDVHEKGTEAAAATAVIMKPNSLPPQRPKATFEADHPFVFLIKENRSNSILFFGRVMDPNAK